MTIVATIPCKTGIEILVTCNTKQVLESHLSDCLQIGYIDTDTANELREKYYPFLD